MGPRAKYRRRGTDDLVGRSAKMAVEPAAGGSSSRWKLTHPERLSGLAVMIAAVILASSVLPALATRVAVWWPTAAATLEGQSADPGRIGILETVIAKPGDTLWTLALKYYPGKDPRLGVARLRADNKLENGGICVGQTLLVEVAAPPGLDVTVATKTSK